MAVTAVLLPHPVTPEGRTVREVAPGSTVRELVAGWGDVVAAVDGRAVGPGDLDEPLPDGAVLVARSLAAGGDDSNPLRTVLQIALLVASIYTGLAISNLGWSTFWKAAASAAIVVGGTLVINAIAPPVLPSLDGGGGSRPDPVYSLVGGANRARPYEPLLLVLGTHRVFPDLAAREYTVFSSAVPAGAATVDGSQVRVGAVFSGPDIASARLARDSAITGVAAELAKYDADPNLVVKLEGVFSGTVVVYEARRAGAWAVVTNSVPGWLRGQPAAPGGSTDQFLHQIFHFGLGALDVEDLRIGDTPLTDFEDVETQWPDAAGALTLVAGNVDTEAGAELADTDWVSRDTAAGAVRVELDFTAQLFELRDDGSSASRSVVLDVELTPPDGGAAQTSAVTLRHGDPSPYRLTVSRDLSATPGVWRVRVKRRTAPTTGDQREAAGQAGDPVRYDDVAWTAIRTFQPDAADYAGQRRLAVRIRANGQLSGRLDRLSGTGRQQVPVWDPDAAGGDGAWTSPRRTSNPAWIFRWYALGVRIGGRLAAGVGLPAARVDDAALKDWGVWCDLHSLGCNAVIDRDMTHQEALAAIAQTGRASPTWSTGRLGVVYDRENRAATAAFTPGNIVAGSFEADWASGAVADEIVCRYVDPDLDWQWNTVRRTVPGVSAADRTATLTLWGVTDRDQAAKACNLQAARQLYHKRRLRWRTGPEGLAVNRGDVVHVSHALVDGGTTGRVLGGGRRNLRLDRELAISAGDMLLLRLPNGDLHASAVSRTADLDDDQVRLADRLDADVAPGAGTSSALDILWRHYAADSPPLRAKVVAVEPRSETEVAIEAIDETPAYYTAAVSDLTVDLPTLHRDWPAVVDIRISEHLVDVGEYQLTEIVATLTVEGNWRGGTVTASLDGGPVRTVAQLGPGELEARWNEPPEGTLTVRAVPGSAAAPAGRAHEVVHVIGGPPFPLPEPDGRPGLSAVSVVLDSTIVAGTPDGTGEIRLLDAGDDPVDPVDEDSAETVVALEVGISADADPPDAATELRRTYLPQVAVNDVVALYEDADRGNNFVDYLVASVPTIAAGARTARFGVAFHEKGAAADVTGACKLGFARPLKGEDGLSRYELTIFRKRVRRTANALATPASASWDHDGTPEAANAGLVGRLTNTGDWSRVFPAYDPETEEVMCAQATGTSADTIPGGWSTPRRCESPAGINTVYKYSANPPAALPDGPARVPAGTADSVPGSGTGILWQNTGVRNAFTRDWTWDGWRRAEGENAPVEIAVYRKRAKGAADPALPTAAWDYDGSPETAGFKGRLTNTGDWSRAFPSYDPTTEEVVCAQTTGKDDDTLTSWSAVRVCENPADINTVYMRSRTKPAALTAGTARVPSGTSDNVPPGADDLWENTGHRGALSNNWTWGGWRRAEGFPGAVELAVYQKRTLGGDDPALPVNTGADPAVWDYDGAPEAANAGLVGRLTNIGDWSRVFPAYAPQTEEVVCSSASGFSSDVLGDWSPVRVCANIPDLNTVYRRAAAEPDALDAGPARVPADTSDGVPDGTPQLWENTGHRAALSAIWTWSGWRRSDAKPGAVELTVYQKRTKGAADAALPATSGDGALVWDYDGEPETAGVPGRLTGIGAWSRAFPAYDAKTEEVVCAQIAGNSDDTTGSWSAIRVCENPADLNKVYKRSATRPAALADGPARVPAGTRDTLDAVPAGTGYVFENTGHRDALSNTWTWDGWSRLDVLDGFPAPQKNWPMSHYAQATPNASGYYAFRGVFGANTIHFAAVNWVTWRSVTEVDIGIGANAALRTYLQSLEPDDWLLVTNDQTGHVGNEPNAIAYARVTAAPTIADDATTARIAVSPARAHPAFYTDVVDTTAGNDIDGADGFAVSVCIGFSRVDTAGLEPDITAALSATAWATAAEAPDAVAAVTTPANRALAASDLPEGVALIPPTVGDHSLWAARLTGAVAGANVRWTAGAWGKVFDPDDLGVTVRDEDFTVSSGT